MPQRGILFVERIVMAGLRLRSSLLRNGAGHPAGVKRLCPLIFYKQVAPPGRNARDVKYPGHCAFGSTDVEFPENMRLIKSKPLKMLLGLLVGASSTFGQSVPDTMDLYLLIGQSNMAGRGATDAASRPNSPKIWAINRQNEWKIAADPLHEDKPAVAGVGPGLTFAQEILNKHPDRPIGLIPCAVGGSGIDDWQPGARHEQTGIYAYDEMLARVKEAQKRGTIKAIIWHQGESDSSPEKKDAYAAKLADFFKRLRRDTHTQNVPLVVGTLGDFYVAKNPGAAFINGVIADYAKGNKRVHLASASGLTHKGDDTHFDTPSTRELGRRYAEAFLQTSRHSAP